MMEGGSGITLQRIFIVEVFFSYQNVDFPFYLKGLLEPSFFPSFFYSPSLEDSRF
jgi:hypothetical protein